LCLPDIMSDSSHDQISNDLEELLDDTELISTTLDALGNFKFQTISTQRIVNKLFAKFNIINEKDLPAVVKYVLKSADSLCSAEILNGLRSKLVFTDIADRSVCVTIFEMIQEYFAISTQLGEQFQSLIGRYILDKQQDSSENSDKSDDDDNIEEQDTAHNNINLELKSIDFIFFSILYSMPQQFKQVDKLFKQLVKIESTVHIENLLNMFLNCNIEVMSKIFPSFFCMAKSLISSNNNEISKVARSIYKIIFLSSNNKCKINLINVLIDHIKCNVGPSRDSSLQILIELCEPNITIKGIIIF
jgi:hypothetical protein